MIQCEFGIDPGSVHDTMWVWNWPGFCAKERRWDEIEFGAKQWQAVCAIVSTTQSFMTHAACHCFTPNAVSSHLTSFVRDIVWVWNSPGLSTWYSVSLEFCECEKVRRWTLSRTFLWKELHDPIPMALPDWLHGIPAAYGSPTAPWRAQRPYHRPSSLSPRWTPAVSCFLPVLSQMAAKNKENKNFALKASPMNKPHQLGQRKQT